MKRNTPCKVVEERGECSSLVQPLIMRPKIHGRIPTYSRFVEPITNNEKANSTLVDLSLEREKVGPSPILESTRNEESDLLNKCILLPRPGPKSYKEKYLAKMRSNLEVPVALDVIENSRDADICNNSNRLQTITECCAELAATPPPENNCNINNTELPLDSNFRETDLNVPSSDLSHLIDQIEAGVDEEHTEEAQIQIHDSNLRDSNNAHNAKEVRFNVNGFAASVTAPLSTPEENDQHLSYSSSVQEADANTPKYIKIIASTVHIHNHFYKQ